MYFKLISYTGGIMKNHINKDIFTFSPNIIFLLISRIISIFGTEIYNFTLALYILKVTGSGLSFAVSLIFGVLPRVILGPIAGTLADRIDRKKLIIISDILSAFIVFVLLIYSILFGLKIYSIYICSLFLNTTIIFFDIAFTSSIPNIVDDKKLMQVYSLDETINSLASIMSPFIGGILFVFININIFIFINVISFLLSTILELFIDFNYNKKEYKCNNIKNNNILLDMMDGISYLKSNKLVLIMYIFALFLNFFFALGLTIPFPYIVNNILKLPSFEFGILEAMAPIGIIAGSIILSIFPERDKKYKTVICGLIVQSFIMILLGLSMLPIYLNTNKFIYFLLYIALIFVLEVFSSIVNISVRVTIQRIIPDVIRGRILGFLSTLSLAITPIGLSISGALIDKLPPYILPLLVGLFLTIITAIMSLNKYVKNI
jgi:MFS family permease